MKITQTIPLLSLLAILFLPVTGEAQSCKDSIMATTPDANFIVHNNGTVTHNSTALMWMRCSLGQKWDGKGCSGQAANHTWQDALQAAGNLKFAGYADWRVPNKNELASILEERCNVPTINGSVFPSTPSSYYWTSTPYAALSHGAWSVDFSFGSINASVKSASMPVRLVRGGR